MPDAKDGPRERRRVAPGDRNSPESTACGGFRRLPIGGAAGLPSVSAVRHGGPGGPPDGYFRPG
ncbi:MAG: hypothetical protein LBT40_11815 [Deltaproteobacteria bacterium]|nr:hypothetical protein [Deltaproteobacteria bacterium]